MTGQPSASPIWFQSFHCDGEDSHDFVPMKHQSSVLLFATASARHVTLRTDRRIHGLQNENGFVYQNAADTSSQEGQIVRHAFGYMFH